jgi:uncharacterized protein involved in exopolysaccharide biosynthesis
MNEKQDSDDEIDLVKLATTVWTGRRLLLITAMCSVALASVYLNIVDRKYTVTLVLKSVQEPLQRSEMSGLGDLVSFTGIELPSGSRSDFASFPLVMESREVAERVLADEVLIQALFKKEWDAQSNQWLRPQGSALRAVLSPVKALLTGDPKSTYAPPDAPRIADTVSKEISASIDKKTNLLSIHTESPDPILARSLVERVVKETDELFRQRFIEKGTSALEFYKEQLARAQSGEHREALAQLIVQEEQKLMLATRSRSYVAETLRGPDVSLRPTSPKSIFVLGLSMILGLFAGAAIVLTRSTLSGGGSE